MIYKAGEYIPAGPPNRKNEMNLCDSCETVSHCTAHGCIPLTECINSGQVLAAHVRDAAIEIERFEPEHDSNGNYMAFYLDGDYVRHSDHIAAIAAERAEVARLTALLKNIRMVHGEWFGNEISSETAITYIGMYFAEDSLTAPGENHE